MITFADLGRDAVIVACAVSAGIHAALVPEHFAEGAGAGLGFLGASVLLAALVVALTRRPANSAAVAGAGAVLAGLIGSYALVTTTGLPLLNPATEAVDTLALTTKVIEAVGLLAAAHVLRRRRPALALTLLQPKGA